MTRAARVGLLVLSAVAVVALISLPRLLSRRDAPPPQGAASIATAARPTPTLYCEFYNFMHNATVVSYLFAVEPASSGDLQFDEMAVVEPDGTRTEYEPGRRVRWLHETEDGTPSIASPDDATRIVLYGFAPRRPGIFWTEAGVRSDTYKNLDGKCRQANFSSSNKG